jgi:hypothetical protein
MAPLRCPKVMRALPLLLISVCATVHASAEALPDPSTPDPALEAEIAANAGNDAKLAEALGRRRLPVSAFIYWDGLLHAGKSHPDHLKALAALPAGTLARIALLIGELNHRKGKIDEALLFVRAVPPESPVHARARYLEALLLVDPRAQQNPDDNGRAAQQYDQLLREFPGSRFADEAHARLSALGKTPQ